MAIMKAAAAAAVFGSVAYAIPQARSATLAASTSAYECNPAHQYPTGQTCVLSGTAYVLSTMTAAASASRASSTAGTVTDTAKTLTNQALESLSSASLAAAKSLGLDSPQHAVEKAKEVVGEL